MPESTEVVELPPMLYISLVTSKDKNTRTAYFECRISVTIVAIL